MNILEIEDGEKIEREMGDGVPRLVHLFDQDSIDAVNAAIAAGRPLLVRGEPGVGKSQLARAVAYALKRAFVSHVVDMHSEPRDLMWRFDAVQRLADAQVSKASGENLAVDRYIHPGPLWWAFDWKGATNHALERKQEIRKVADRCSEKNGCVILVDEIDKAEMDLPNGLLEAMGEGSFTPMGMMDPVKVKGDFPLVIITTNEERALPRAFLRRCLVLHIDPFADQAAAEALLKERGKAHLPQLGDGVIAKAIEQSMQDRDAARDNPQQPKPGQAEFLDLLRAVNRLSGGDDEKAEALIDRISRFVTAKQAGNRE